MLLLCTAIREGRMASIEECQEFLAKHELHRIPKQIQDKVWQLKSRQYEGDSSKSESKRYQSEPPRKRQKVVKEQDEVQPQLRRKNNSSKSMCESHQSEPPRKRQEQNEVQLRQGILDTTEVDIIRHYFAQHIQDDRATLREECRQFLVKYKLNCTPKLIQKKVWLLRRKRYIL